MSRLRLFWPDEHAAATSAVPEPHILPMHGHGSTLRLRQNSSQTERARALHENRQCPECARPLVEPIELADALLTRNRLPIPGTATLVGFRCTCCRLEWPA
jgi:hypothetical protein